MMKYLVRTLRILVVGFVLAPLATLSAIGRRFLPAKDGPSQIRHLRETTAETPLILQIETVNACNAACAFCAYPQMQRKRGVMSMALFEKVIDDYVAMGGGPVSFTPVVGDALLDPHLLERLKLIGVRNEINQASLTTNGIALEAYSDDEIRVLLQSLDCIQVSIGGLDADTYRTLFGVDKFQQVQRELERLLTIKETLSSSAALSFAFRTNDWLFELRFKRRLDEYRRRGVFISHIWTYANYSGVVKSDSTRKLDVFEEVGDKSETCIYPCVHMAVCWDGQVTACGCADFEGDKLRIGHVAEESLAGIWRGTKRQRICTSFPAGRLVPICRDCTAYQGDSFFAAEHFREIAPHQPLPLDYFRKFWGG